MMASEWFSPNLFSILVTVSFFWGSIKALTVPVFVRTIPLVFVLTSKYSHSMTMFQHFYYRN